MQSVWILWILECSQKVDSNCMLLQPPREGDPRPPQQPVVPITSESNMRVPSKLIIPDIFCGTNKSAANGSIPHNGIPAANRSVKCFSSEDLDWRIAEQTDMPQSICPGRVDRRQFRLLRIEQFKNFPGRVSRRTEIEFGRVK